MVQTKDIPVMALQEQITENHPAFLESLRHRFLDDDRKAALQRFERAGFPTKKDEEYKYTNLKEITEKAYSFFPKENHNITKEQLDQLHLGTTSNRFFLVSLT